MIGLASNSPSESTKDPVEAISGTTRWKSTNDGITVTETTIPDLATEDDIVVVGATLSGAVSQARCGSFPEKIKATIEGTVVIARGPDETPMSIREVNRPAGIVN